MCTGSDPNTNSLGFGALRYAQQERRRGGHTFSGLVAGKGPGVDVAAVVAGRKGVAAREREERGKKQRRQGDERMVEPCEGDLDWIFGYRRPQQPMWHYRATILNLASKNWINEPSNWKSV